MGVVQWITGPLGLNLRRQVKLLAAHFSEPFHPVGGTMHGKHTRLRGHPYEIVGQPNASVGLPH